MLEKVQNQSATTGTLAEILTLVFYFTASIHRNYIHAKTAMAFIQAFKIAWILFAHILLAIGAAGFSGNFEITNLAVDCPSESDATSTADSFVCCE